MYIYIYVYMYIYIYVYIYISLLSFLLSSLIIVITTIYWLVIWNFGTVLLCQRSGFVICRHQEMTGGWRANTWAMSGRGLRCEGEFVARHVGNLWEVYGKYGDFIGNMVICMIMIYGKYMGNMGSMVIYLVISMVHISEVYG